MADTPTSLPLVQGLWVGRSLSVMERLSIASFLQHGHPYHLYVYDDPGPVPAGAVLRDAAEILSADRIFTYRRHRTYSGFSNLFRYRLLFGRGGCWADTDLVCLRPVTAAADLLFAGQRVHFPRRLWRGAVQATNCFIKAPAAAPVMGHCHHTADGLDPQRLRWGQTGPDLVRAAVRRFGLGFAVLPATAFCPVNWWRWQLSVDAGFGRRWRRAMAHGEEMPFGIHLWHEMWRRSQTDPDRRQAPDCIYEQLKARYLG